ncbi:MAG: hypothetical protein J5654_00475 [Victivallales bacterium]|nr:hypothetical protein [Victivallales bacterium]
MTISILLIYPKAFSEIPATSAETEFHDYPELPPPHPAGPPHHGKGDRMPPPVRYYFTQLKQENPAEYERLLKLRMEDREQFMKEMTQRFPRQHDPAEEKFRELDQKCWELARQLQTDPPPENADELRNQLNELVAESVDSMIQQTQQRLEEIQARLKQMEHLRDRIVQQRLDFYMKHPRPPKPPLPQDDEKTVSEQVSQ